MSIKRNIPEQQKAILLALVATLLWSTVAVPFKIGLQYFHFIHFLFISISVALLVLFATLLFSKKLFLLKSLDKKQWMHSIASGILNPFLYYLILFKAYSILPAQIAQALNYTWPIMLVLLSVPILKQRLNAFSLFTLLLGFVGVFFISSQGKLWPIQPANPFGVILALSSSVVWALYWLVNAKSKVNPLINLFVSFFVAWILTFILLFFVPMDAHLNVKAWFAVIYSGIFEMGITFIIWLAALRLTQRTDQISNYVFLSPFLSLFFIYLILGEEIYATTIIGLVLIIGSMLLKVVPKQIRRFFILRKKSRV